MVYTICILSPGDILEGKAHGHILEVIRFYLISHLFARNIIIISTTIILGMEARIPNRGIASLLFSQSI